MSHHFKLIKDLFFLALVALPYELQLMVIKLNWNMGCPNDVTRVMYTQLTFLIRLISFISFSFWATSFMVHFFLKNANSLLNAFQLQSKVFS